MMIDENSAQVTTGEVFEDGMIEIVRDAAHPNGLLLWHSKGKETSIAARVERNGTVYAAPAIDPTIVRAITLPTRSALCGPVRELLDSIAKAAAVYGGLEDERARPAGRFILSSWLVDALPVAPSLRIVGPETVAGNQLFQILGGLCRHAVRLADADVAGIRSLPPQLGLTLLIRQPELSARLWRLLDAVRRPGEFIPRGRRLLDLHGAVATYSRFGSMNGDRFAGIEIPVPAPNRTVEILNEEALRRITDDFQAKLLSYRFQTYGCARDSKYDAPQFLSPIRELTRSLAACTPDDDDLQDEVVGLLGPQDEELRSERWTDLTVIVLEALLCFIHEALASANSNESKSSCVYVGEIAEAAEALFQGRGENREVEPRAVGEQLRLLGLKTERRDSRGIKLMLSQVVCRRVHEWARSFAVPATEKTMAGCTYCDPRPPASAA